MLRGGQRKTGERVGRKKEGLFSPGFQRRKGRSAAQRRKSGDAAKLLVTELRKEGLSSGTEGREQGLEANDG